LLPAFALAILIARPRLRLRTILISLGLFVLGLSVWLYIPLRWPALHGGVPMTFDEFIGWITGSRFGGALVLSAWSDPTRWSIVTRFLLDAFSPVGAALAAIGLIGLAVTALMLLATIDGAFNTIWRVTKRRPLAARLMAYWAILTLGPLLGVYSRPGPGIVAVVFSARAPNGRPRCGHEALELAWFEAGSIPWDDLAFETTRWALRDWVALHGTSRRRRKARAGSAAGL